MWTAFRDELPPRDVWIWARRNEGEDGIRMKPVIPWQVVLEYYPHLKDWRLDSDRSTAHGETVTKAGTPLC